MIQVMLIFQCLPSLYYSILTVTIASELAVRRNEVRGPGTFRSALIDELYNVTNDTSLIAEHAKVRVIQ